LQTAARVPTQGAQKQPLWLVVLDIIISPLPAISASHLTWSIDTTEYGPNKINITPLQDLASKYQLPAPLVAPAEEGNKIAVYLERMFRQQGPPTFLKRDLGSPLNCLAVGQVLERYHVLPSTARPASPRRISKADR
jgi:hypothetical protein